MKDTKCKFCRIIAGKEPASKVYEDDYCVAFLDLYPLNPGHTLIIPKHHAATLDELDDFTAAHLMKVAKLLTVALRKTNGICCSGVNLLMANGASAGQEVFHAHLHLLPRFESDGIRFGRPARQVKTSRLNLDVCATAIRNSISVP